MGHVTALRLLLVLALAMVGSAVADAHDGSAHPPGLSEAVQLSNVSPASGTATLAGWLHVLYGDAPPGWTPGGTSGYVLLDDQGEATELLVPDDVLRAAGGRRAVNGRHMTVVGRSFVTSRGAGGPMPLLGVQALQPTERQALGVPATQRAVTGPQPWVTILCRFADEPAVTPRTQAWFESLILGSTAPGLDHYWREVSYGNVNLTGSVVVGWYTLPQPRSYYVYGSPLQLDHSRAASDCTAVADADVYFPGFVGINLAFNDNLDCCAWGGSWTLTRDGQTRTYRMTWLPPWGYENQGPVAHEMGHGFGLPHSSGPYTATYDSGWDVMSGIWLDCPPYDPSYGCVGTHTISYHKDILGWIPAAQRYVAAAGTSQTITLERLGQPTTGNYLMAKIPIAGSATNFYTVEVRRFAGYDVNVPGEAVVIHKVDTTRSDRDAQVVDRDGNGDPSDAGSMWLPGATFLDSPNGISVSVVAQTATGFQVTVSSGAASTYSLSVTVSGTGTVTSGPAGISCSTGVCGASFPAGTSVTLTPSGGTLSAWSGACSGSNGCTVSMTANQSVTATFAAQTFALTVSPAPSNGTVTGLGIGCPGDCSESIASGTSVVLTASPATGYQLGAWSGCQSVSGALCTVQMTQARTVAVTFTPIAYTLQVSPAPSNGTVTGLGIGCPGDCSESIASGTSVVLTASPATGYLLGAWSGCQSVTGAVCTVQMTQARTVAVTFTPIAAYTLQVSPAPSNGTVTGPGIGCPGDCSESVTSGTNFVLTANPAPGYQVGAWSGCQSVSGAVCTVQMTQARTVAVTFDRTFYMLTVSPVPTNGKVAASGISCGTGTTADCVQSVASGTSVVLTASPAAGYQVGAWSGCQSVSGTKCTVQMTQARAVAVTFNRIFYMLTVSPVPTQGTITGLGISCGTGIPADCTESIASGTSVVLTASPAPGYRLGVWSGCQSVSGAQCTVKMTKARTVFATFVSMTASAYGAAYQSVPITVTAGAAVTAPVAVTNAGSLYWDAAGYRLGYRWYQGSTQLSKDKSNLLPTSVAPGASATVLARIVAPSTPGSYTIRWDMVQLGTTNIWFASQGVPTGDFAVTVR